MLFISIFITFVTGGPGGGPCGAGAATLYLLEVEIVFRRQQFELLSFFL